MKVFKYLSFSTLVAISVSGASAQDHDKCYATFWAHDYTNALKECFFLAEQGDLESMGKLASMYYDGNGVIQNYVKAFMWTRLAAQGGEWTSQAMLGAMYSKGEGVLQDNLRAYMWYNIASINGDTSAVKWRDDVAIQMTRADISEAQGMAQECISSGYKSCGD